MAHLDTQPPPAPQLVRGTSPPPGADRPDPGPRPARLTRSRQERVLGGVAGGIAEYLAIDPVLVRLVFVVLALAGGGGVVAYLVAWAVIPERPEGEEAPAVSADEHRPLPHVLAGGLLVVLGSAWFLQELVPGVARVTLPLALILIGVVIVVTGSRHGDRTGGGS